MAPSPTIRRLLKETSELSPTAKNPNPAFHAAPVSDTDLHEWHFTLLGPPSPSPYAGGLYHGRISLPPSYPLKPPNFRFLTPSGRFEVNREICLSISGFHEETWMPAWGVRTALTALRSFMAESGTAGQVGGLEAPKEVRLRLARESRGWRCKECGSRTNEDIMREWWEACAAKGVKVGEDIGLEALPEGLNLEAKVPAGSRPDQTTEEEKGEKEGKSTGHGPDEIRQATLTDAPIQVPLSHHPMNVSQSTTQPVTYRADQSTGHVPSQSSVIVPMSPPNRSPTASNRSTPQPHSSISATPSQHQPDISTTESVISKPLLQASHPPQTPQSPALVNSSLPSTQQRQQRQPQQPQAQQLRSEEPTTVTIDRAIYVVFVALCVMILKKIFYPASDTGQWGDMTVMRE